jgi:hypothetical protein
MDSIIHKIDPKGDTLLVLRNPNAPFAVGDASSTWPNALPKYRTEKMRKNERELIYVANTEQSTIGNEREIYFQLSSKHLTLASGYFRGLMANNWSEASSSLDFAYSVTAEDWDEAALRIVMNIIHCQTGKIPRTVDLEMLTKVAVIVDYYQCREAVAFYAGTWFKKIRSKELDYRGYGRKLLLRLFASCVFLQHGDFRLLTEEIIRESRGPIHSLGLPFPQNIIGELYFLYLKRSSLVASLILCTDALENERINVVSGIISSLYSLIEELITGNRACSFGCSSVSLGALMKGMKAMNLLNPRPTSPFEGYSLVAMGKALGKIQEPDYDAIQLSASEYQLFMDRACPHIDTCFLSARIRSIWNAQDCKIKGLILNKYIDTNRDS